MLYQPLNQVNTPPFNHVGEISRRLALIPVSSLLEVLRLFRWKRRNPIGFGYKCDIMKSLYYFLGVTLTWKTL